MSQLPEYGCKHDSCPTPGKCETWGCCDSNLVQRKEKVLRCPNADDSCTFPDCNHVLQIDTRSEEEKETEMAIGFSARKANGDPLAAIRDIVKSLTYDEMLRMSQGLNIKPEAINDWARGTQTVAGGLTPTQPVVG